MSIVSKLQKKIIVARLTAFACFGVYIGGLFVRNGANSQLLVALPFIGVLGSALYTNAIAKCPQCKAKLLRDRFGLGLDKNAHSCWSCGVDFNAEALPAASVQTPKG